LSPHKKITLLKGSRREPTSSWPQIKALRPSTCEDGANSAKNNRKVASNRPKSTPRGERLTTNFGKDAGVVRSALTTQSQRARQISTKHFRGADKPSRSQTFSRNSDGRVAEKSSRSQSSSRNSGDRVAEKQSRSQASSSNSDRERSRASPQNSDREKGIKMPEIADHTSNDRKIDIMTTQSREEGVYRGDSSSGTESTSDVGSCMGSSSDCSGSVGPQSSSGDNWSAPPQAVSSEGAQYYTGRKGSQTLQHTFIYV
jgi:hypothetical protein